MQADTASERTPNTPHPLRGRRIAHEPGIASPDPVWQARRCQREHGTGPLSRTGILALHDGEDVNQQVTAEDVGEGRANLTGTYLLPLHGAFLRDLGFTLNEVMDLSGLAEQCAEDGIYEFMFSGAPLHVEMATGGPINPVVVKATAESGMDEDSAATETETETETATTTDADTTVETGAEQDAETGETEATTASGDGFGIAAAAAGIAGVAGAAARALRDGSTD